MTEPMSESTTRPDLFSALTRDLTTRAARAVVSQLGVSCNPLRAYLQQLFERDAGRPGSFLADPVAVN